MLYQKQNSTGKFFFEHILYENFNFQLHMHRHPELIRVRQGIVELEINGVSEEVIRGEYAWVPSNCLHSYRTKELSQVDVCIFSDDYVPMFTKEIRGKRPKTAVFHCCKAVSEFAENMLFSAEHLPDIYILKSILYALSGEIINNTEFEKSGKSALLQDKILQYVADNFTEDISLKTAALFNLAVRQLAVINIHI